MSTAEGLTQRGYAVLRGCFDKVRLTVLSQRVERLYAQQQRRHIEPRELRYIGEDPYHEDLFELIHYDLLDRIFPRGWLVSESTCSRRIGPEDVTYQRPLRPHLDAFFHDHQYTVNFWTPLQACGNGNVPGLTVWPMTLDAVRKATGYKAIERERRSWHFGHFDRRWEEQFENGGDWVRKELGDGETPKMEFGDAILLTNWTLHATGPGNPAARRTNVELRFHGQ